MEERIKTEIRYRCPECHNSISERAMCALRDAHEANYHSCLHCRKVNYSQFVRVQWVDVLVWNDAGELAFDQCSFEVHLLGGDDDVTARKIMSTLPCRRTNAGYEVQLPNATWLRTNRFADWLKVNSGVFIDENKLPVEANGMKSIQE